MSKKKSCKMPTEVQIKRVSDEIDASIKSEARMMLEQIHIIKNGFINIIDQMEKAELSSKALAVERAEKDKP